MVLGSGKPGWLGRQSVRVKALLAVGTATAAFVGLGLASAVPASADPGTTYIAVGSNTTQNIVDAFATTTGGLVGSYDAVDPVTGTTLDMVNAFQNSGTSSTLQTFLRPNGSGDGFTALRYSNGTNLSALTPYDSGTAAEMPKVGAIAFSRSSGSPTAVAGAANLSTTGQYQWIPFAYDNLALSVGATTNITTAADFTVADLTALYENCDAVTAGGITYWPLGSPNPEPSGATVIDLYIPQTGSGSRSTWLTDITGSTTPSVCVFDTGQDPSTATFNQLLEENNGVAVADDPNGVFPYSAGDWLYETSLGTSNPGDLTDGAVLQPITVGTTEISPLNAAGTALNTTTFPIFRELYNVFITSQVVGANADPNLVRMFVGATSALCQSSGIIREFGFVSLASTTQAPDPCGSTSDTLRAYASG
jgi:hypothetical protein